MPVVTDGGRGTGVEAESSLFPFVDPSDDIHGLLADFYLAHEVDVVLPLRLVWIYGLCGAQGSCGSTSSHSSNSSGGVIPDPVHDVDLLVVDSDGKVVFDSTQAADFRQKAWGGRFVIYEWIAETAVCRILAHSGVNEAEDARIYPHEIFPEDGRLDERVSERMPRRVNSITVLGEAYKGTLNLQNGYNLELDQTENVGTSRRLRNRFTISVSPGIGAGRYPGCVDPEIVIRRMAGVGPDQYGNFKLAATDCYWIERPSEVVSDFPRTVAVTPHTLTVHNDCGPCCECEDFEKVYNGIRRLYDRLKEVGRRAEGARNLFRENAARWRAERTCRQEHPTRIALVPSAGGYLDVQAAFCSGDDDCKYDIEMRVAFQHSGGKRGTVEEGTVFVSKLSGSGTEEGVLEGTWPTFTTSWDSLRPGQAARVRFRLRFLNVRSGEAVTATVTPRISGVNQTPETVTRALRA